jgi:hypothetical protein
VQKSERYLRRKREREKGLQGAAVECTVAKGKGNAEITNEEEEKERTWGVTESVPRSYPSFFRKLNRHRCKGELKTGIKRVASGVAKVAVSGKSREE